ncbi:dynamin family protein [Saccharothrix sp. Mg75]|uniref:dynamin family protein n=1 Tax=Saccharothrix sp. Mg75 TaxID=3445357 RepID=UPI003EEFD7AD
MNDLVRCQAELREVLDRLSVWLADTASLDDPAPDPGAADDLAADVELVATLRTRAASSLINLALVGHFSSGKSFLLSGLQQRLDYTPVVNDLGDTADKYTGLLPSASEPTSACPATVIPVDRPSLAERGVLRVRFTDSDAWEEIGSEPIPAVVAAYCTEDPELIVEGRKRQHQHRTVAEVEILVHDVPLPAKLYDLPGAFSPNPVHDEILRAAIVEADCFLYVSQATTTLSNAELGLIKSLYDQHTYSGKKVIWVLTGIDRAGDLGRGDRPKWEHTAKHDDEYLRENFRRSTGEPDERFIGRGFIGVSPALQARGEWQIRNGEHARGNRLIAASRMNELRRLIGEVVEGTTGATHLAQVAGEALGVVAPHFRAVGDRLQTARTPLAKLQARKDELVPRLQALDLAIDSIREQLGKQLASRARAVKPAFAGLAPSLHEALDHVIRSTDLMNTKEANRVEVLKTQAIQDWVVRPGGPVDAWNREMSAFIDRTRLAVRTGLRDSYASGQFDLTQEKIDLNRLDIPSSPRYRAGAQDVVGRAAAVVGTVTPVGAGVAAALGIVTGPLLLIPAGVAVGAGLLYAALRHRRYRSSSMDLLHNEWIAELDGSATRYEDSFLAVVDITGTAVIDRAEAILRERSNELANEIVRIERSIDDPENLHRKDVVEVLEPHVARGSAIMTTLDRLSGLGR